MPAASRLRAALLALPLLAPLPAMAEVPKVLATVAPLHSLTAAVMAGVGTPELLIPGSVSEHQYSLKPSDARKIEGADLVVWVGAPLESVLAGPMDSLADAQHRLTLSERADLRFLPPRAGAAWEPHHLPGEEDHDDEEHEAAEKAEAESGLDGHFWLDPQRAKQAAADIAERLSTMDPEHAATYAANLEGLDTQLDALDRDLAAKLAPVKDKPFIVLHDAYQYLQQRYDLSGVGAITVTPEAAPSAERLSTIRNRLKETQAVCVFAEPQAPQRLVDVVVEGSSARSSTLDPLGAGIAPGPDLYPALMRRIADRLAGCLSGS